MHRLYVTAPAGTADLAAEELAACGVDALKVERGGVAFEGTLEQAYRACLWSRVANRVLARLHPEMDLRVLTYQTLFRSLRDAPGLDQAYLDYLARRYFA